MVERRERRRPLLGRMTALTARGKGVVSGLGTGVVVGLVAAAA